MVRWVLYYLKILIAMGLPILIITLLIVKVYEHKNRIKLNKSINDDEKYQIIGWAEENIEKGAAVEYDMRIRLIRKAKNKNGN